jgi:PAS domain S-box-containing protein
MLAQLAPEALCQAILDHHPDTVFVVDAQARIYFANRGHGGVGSAALVGRSIEDLMHAEFRPQFHMLLSDTVHTGRAHSLEVALIGGPNGREWRQCRIGAISREGRVLGGVVIFTAAAAAVPAENVGTVIDVSVGGPHGLIALCAWCKRVRDQADVWISVEEFIRRRDNLSVSHGICPTCFEKHSGEMPTSP